MGGAGEQDQKKKDGNKTNRACFERGQEGSLKNPKEQKTGKSESGEKNPGGKKRGGGPD